MTTAATYQIAAPVTKRQKRYLELQPHDWLWPLAALLSLAMIGLEFPLGYIALVIVMINRFFKNRYDFLIIFALWCGGYSFTAMDSYRFFQSWNVGGLVCILGAIFLRWNTVTKKSMIALGLYALAFIGLATLSDESMRVQAKLMKSYFFFIYFVLPLLVFANREFNVAEFFKRLFPYALIACIFYIIDCVVFSGNVLVPNTHLSSNAISRFYALYWSPLSFGFLRKYPPGLFMLVLLIYPVQNFYKLRLWQWVVIGIALLTTRTFTFISALVIVYLLFQDNTRRTALYLAGLIVVMIPVYFFDKAMGVVNGTESTLRISSTIDQFTSLGSAQDDEDLAEFGSGRMAQALPKLDLVYQYKKQWVGLGFLHPTETKNPKYIIFNEYYSDIEKAEEAAAGIEIEVLQTFVNVGYLGLLVYFLFYAYTCWVIRKYKIAKLYYTSLLAVFWMGMGGFATLAHPHGLILVGMAYGVVILSEKNKTNLRYTEQLLNGKPTTDSDTGKV